jgi:signal peptidase
VRKDQSDKRPVQDGEKELLTSAAHELIADALHRFGSVRLQVTGSSMLPAVRPHDVLIVERCPIDQIHISDIVLFADAGRLFAHRVIRLGIDATGAPTLETRGDTHRLADRPIRSHQLLGRVSTVWRDGRELPAPFRYSRATSVIAIAAALGLRLAARLGIRG